MYSENMLSNLYDAEEKEFLEKFLSGNEEEMSTALGQLFDRQKSIGKAMAVIELLAEIGNLSQELIEYIAAERNLKILGDYVRAAARAESVKDFEQIIGFAQVRERRFHREKAEGKAEGIIELLEDIGEPPETLRKYIMGQTDFEVLRRWLKAAAGAETIEDFERAAGLVQAQHG